MKLTEKALQVIKQPHIRRELTVALKCTDQTIIRYIKGNEENGPLTLAASLKVIREVAELKDQEILEGEEEVAAK
jgi:hypothetical protein